MQTAIETQKNNAAIQQITPEQISKLFNFEAEYSKSFSERTVVPPAIIENPTEVTSQLTDDVWLLINGEKGSGKTSCLYYTRHQLRVREIQSSMSLYVAFDSDDIKAEIHSTEEKASFLVNYFYKPLIRELATKLASSQRRPPKHVEEIVRAMVSTLGLTKNDLRQIFPEKERSGIVAWLLKLLGLDQKNDHGNEKSGSPQSNKLPNYSEFRDALIQLADSLGFNRIYLLIDEVNEQRLSKSEQQVLFDHIYNTYRTAKERVTMKIATTSSVELPDFIYHGHYFMPMELSSMLLHPLEYEEMLRTIFEKRLREICDTHEVAASTETSFSNFFTDASFRVLAQASMGNVREFFFLSKMAHNLALPSGRIEFNHAQRVVRNRASELEERIKEKGESLFGLYLRLVSLLQERSNAKLARRKESVPRNEAVEIPMIQQQQEEEEEPSSFSQRTGLKGQNEESENSGVSYFMISNYDSLSQEDRDLLEVLENEKAIFGTGEWKSLRRRGAKQKLYAISYLVCSLRGIKWQDVSYLARNGDTSERELIDHGRCQIAL